MKNTKQLIKLENIKKNVDLKIQQLKNKISLDNSHQRQKENNHKKKLARTFLSSKIFKLVGNNSFSMYELFTIAGLIILNDLQKYDSATLVASYNQIISKAIKDGDYKSELAQIGKERYIEDRTIEKDIEPILQLIHAILIASKTLIENSDLDKLKEEGNKYFIARRNMKVQNQLNQFLKNIRKV
jgi:uncharacterized protein Veg